MKKYLSLLFVLVLVFVTGVYKVHAHDPYGPEENRNAKKLEFQQERKEALDDWKDTREDIKAKRMEMINDMKEKREAWKEDMKEHWQDGVKMVRGRILIAFMQRTENLANIAERIETRIDKIEAEGKDTGDAQSFVDQAQEKIESAKNKIEDLKNDIEGDKSIEELKSKLSAIKEDLKSAHSNLRSAVEEIKKNVAKE